jgi:hypothetical protein
VTERRGIRRELLLNNLKDKKILEIKRGSTRSPSGELGLEEAMDLSQVRL